MNEMKGLIELGWFGEMPEETQLDDSKLPTPYHTEPGIAISDSESGATLGILGNWRGGRWSWG